MWRKHPSISNSSDVESRTAAVFGKRRADALMKSFTNESNGLGLLDINKIELLLRYNGFFPTVALITQFKKRYPRNVREVDLQVCLDAHVHTFVIHVGFPVSCD